LSEGREVHIATATNNISLWTGVVFYNSDVLLIVFCCCAEAEDIKYFVLQRV